MGNHVSLLLLFDTGTHDPLAADCKFRSVFQIPPFDTGLTSPTSNNQLACLPGAKTQVILIRTSQPIPDRGYRIDYISISLTLSVHISAPSHADF